MPVGSAAAVPAHVCLDGLDDLLMKLLAGHDAIQRGEYDVFLGAEVGVNESTEPGDPLGEVIQRGSRAIAFIDPPFERRDLAMHHRMLVAERLCEAMRSLAPSDLIGLRVQDRLLGRRVWKEPLLEEPHHVRHTLAYLVRPLR